MIDKYELTKIVSMSNDLLKSEYYTQPELELTPVQKKFITIAVARIEKGDKEFGYEEISIRDFCELFELNTDGATNRKQIRKTILELGKKCFILPVAPGEEEMFRWVDDIKINYNKGVIKIKLGEKLRPYYLDLKARFTKYQLGYVIDLEHKYSQTLYEFLKSKQSLGVFYYDVEDAKRELAYGKYPNFADFEKRVLIPAVEEINRKTDITVSYNARKNGRKYDLLTFHVKTKKGKALAIVDEWKIRYNQHEKGMQAANEDFGYDAAIEEIENGILNHHKSKKAYEDTLDRMRYKADIPLPPEARVQLETEFEKQRKKMKKAK